MSNAYKDLALSLKRGSKSEHAVRNIHPDLYKYIMETYTQPESFPEKFTWLVNDYQDFPKCPVCGNNILFDVKAWKYKQFCCRQCANKGKVEAIQATKLARYGSASYNNHKQAVATKIDKYGSESYNNREQAAKTSISRYGVISFNNHEKAKKTKLEKYGDENFTNQAKREETNLERFGSISPASHKDVQKKIAETKLEKYGDAHFSNSEKRKQTCLERYGFESSLQVKEIREKVEQTKLEKYGDKNFNREKIKQTCQERYGVDYYMSTDAFQETAKQSKLERYGNAYYADQDKRRKTLLDRYGNEHFNNKKLREQNCLDKYGVSNPASLPEVIEKRINTKRQNHIQNSEHILFYTPEGDWVCKCPHPECNKCQEKNYVVTSAMWWDRKRDHTEPCTRLLPYDVNRGKNGTLEIFIQKFLEIHNIPFETNVRDIIKPKELDIYIPSKKLAIECNGVFWHAKRNSQYHIDKFVNCQKQGIQLLSFWEDQINNKPDIVLSVLSSKLGIYKRKIGARKCIIKEIDAKECNNFLEINHIQGKTNSQVKLGLYYDGELVSVMTFGKKRGCCGIKEDIWELSRFACSLNTLVVGGASRLLNHFTKTYKPISVVSFSSNDISNGSLYKTLGFQKEGNITSAYWYIKKDNFQRFHRTNFSKARLKAMGFDIEGKTEQDIMQEQPYYKIWDSGHQRWVLNINDTDD